MEPIKQVVFDFESYYDDNITIKKLGMVGYIEHPQFDAYMVSIAGIDKYGEPIAWVGHPDEAPWERIEGIIWWAHNASFDGYIWIWMVERFQKAWGAGPCALYCTANMSCYLGAPRSLAGAVKQLLPNAEASKDPRNWAKGKTGNDIKAAGKWQYMCDYALGDSQLPYRMILEYADRWPAWERALGFLTSLWGWNGVHIDVPKLNAGIETLLKLRADALTTIPWCSEGELDEQKPLSMQELQAYLFARGLPCPVSTAIDDDECSTWEIENPRYAPIIQGMREYRRTNKMLQLLLTIRTMTRADGTMPYAIKYWGAHTGRWSGGAEKDDRGVPKSLNMQNLYRKTMFGVNVRELFIPAPGCKFIICDLDQIEPRCLAWLVGNHDFLEKVGAGVSPYEVHARLTMGYTDPRPLAETDKQLYNLAKARVLSLGYGCGAARFVFMAAQYGITLTEEESRQIVNSFRAGNPLITAFWARLDRFVKSCRDDICEIELPSGRCLTYYDVQVKMRQCSARVQMGGSRKKMYGGLLAENITQAVARDVFAQNLLKLHEWLEPHDRCRIVWHVHDEAIVEVPAEMAPEMVGSVEQILGSNVSWLPGCPISAGAGIHDYYTKG